MLSAREVVANNYQGPSLEEDSEQENSTEAARMKMDEMAADELERALRSRLFDTEGIAVCESRDWFVLFVGKPTLGNCTAEVKSVSHSSVELEWRFEGVHDFAVRGMEEELDCTLNRVTCESSTFQVSIPSTRPLDCSRRGVRSKNFDDSILGFAIPVRSEDDLPLARI